MPTLLQIYVPLTHTHIHTHRDLLQRCKKHNLLTNRASHFHIRAYISEQVRETGDSQTLLRDKWWLANKIYFSTFRVCVHILTEVVCSCICSEFGSHADRYIPMGRARKIGNSQNMCSWGMASGRTALMPTVGLHKRWLLRVGVQ